MKTEKLNTWLTLGANFGVVVGLILLIIEIQQNTNMMEAQINQSRTESAIEWHAAIFNSELMPSILDKLENGEELNGEETERYTRYLIATMRTLDNQLWQSSRGYLGTTTPRSVAGSIQEELSRSDFSIVTWDRLKFAFSDEFITFVEEVISDLRSADPIGSSGQAADEMPLWAYAVSTPPQPGDRTSPFIYPEVGVRLGDDVDEVNRLHRVEGSDAEYSRMEIRDGHNVVDWFPGDHPQMGPIMRNGPASMVERRGWGCAHCHLPNGKGRPENAPPAGQPVGYTIQQLRDMAAGLRTSADPRKRNSLNMNELAAAMTEEEMQEAAEYFAALPWTPWIEVIEAEMIPEMHLEEGNMFIAVGTEPAELLDGRIVEVPVDAFQSNYLRNTRSSWIAYVPVGSLARGEDLVVTGGQGKTIPCGSCHGSDLAGLANFPGIAGRSPSYMMRQLWDMKVGTRRGLQSAAMRQVIENLTVTDMTDIVAYLASLSPAAGVQ